MNRLMLRFAVSAGLVISLAAPRAFATAYSIDWMQMTPTPFGSAPPFLGNYALPGIGSVQMSYSADADFSEARLQVPQLVAGSVTDGPDTYSWTNHEELARTNWAYSGVTNSPWSVTYTFSGTIPASSLVLGVQGLGRRDPNSGETVADTTTIASVLQTGYYFGDYTGALNFGATLFTPGAGSFTMENSVSGAGGADPWWNTGLAVVRIDDAVSSLTVHFDQTSGDGIGVNLGVITPEPGALGLLAIGSLFVLRRRG